MYRLSVSERSLQNQIFDECGIKLPSAMSRQYGGRALEIQRYMATANVTVNLTASLAGVCDVITVDGPALLTQRTFYNSLKRPKTL